MGIKSFINKHNKTITGSRLTDKGNGKRAFATVVTAENVAIQEMDARSREQIDMVQDRGWTAYANIDLNVQKGDKWVDSNGVEYKVAEVTKKDYGINEHLELILIEHNS
jgi:hypothetical protein